MLFTTIGLVKKTISFKRMNDFQYEQKSVTQY